MSINRNDTTPDEVFVVLRQLVNDALPNEHVNINELIGFITGLVCSPIADCSEKYTIDVFLANITFNSEEQRIKYVQLTQFLFQILNYVLRDKILNYNPLVFNHLDELIDFEQASINIKNEFVFGFVIALNKSLSDYKLFEKHALNAQIRRYCSQILALDMKRGDDYLTAWNSAFLAEETESAILSHKQAYESVQKVDLYGQINSIIKDLYSTSSEISKQHPVKPYKIGRNDRCPCGSGKKYKKCCADNISNPLMMVDKYIAEIKGVS